MMEPVPALGEHGLEILREAGCTEAEIERILNPGDVGRGLDRG